MVIILATRSEVRGFKLAAESMDFFRGQKILSTTSFGRQVKSMVPCRSLRNVKESQAEIRASEQNLLDFPRSM